MKSDTQLMNIVAQKSEYIHYLTEEESKVLKRMLLIMLRDVSEIMSKYSLTYLLAGGTCLGAVRHKGFIPWDDDLDIMMPRDSYERFIELCQEGVLGDKYVINLPTKTSDSKTPYLKVYRKGTKDNELFNENTPFPKGIFLDVFPMANAPRNSFARFIHGLLSDCLLVISTSVFYTQFPSRKYAEFVKGSKETSRRYRIRLFIGRVFGIIPHKKWVYWFDKLNSSHKQTGLITIPNGRKHYLGELQPEFVFFPVSYLSYEGIEAPVPNKYDVYLSTLYGDYMRIPPEEKRERHLVYEFFCKETDE